MAVDAARMVDSTLQPPPNSSRPTRTRRVHASCLDPPIPFDFGQHKGIVQKTAVSFSQVAVRKRSCACSQNTDEIAVGQQQPVRRPRPLGRESVVILDYQHIVSCGHPCSLLHLTHTHTSLGCG